MVRRLLQSRTGRGGERRRQRAAPGGQPCRRGGLRRAAALGIEHHQALFAQARGGIVQKLRRRIGPGAHRRRFALKDILARVQRGQRTAAGHKIDVFHSAGRHSLLHCFYLAVHQCDLFFMHRSSAPLLFDFVRICICTSITKVCLVICFHYSITRPGAQALLQKNLFSTPRRPLSPLTAGHRDGMIIITFGYLCALQRAGGPYGTISSELSQGKKPPPRVRPAA